MNARVASLVTRFKSELAADKKRATLLAVLLLVFCSVFGRLIIGRGEPATVAAQASVVTTVATAGPVAAVSAAGSGAVVPSVRPSLEVTPPAAPFEDRPGTQPPATQAPAKSIPDARPLKPVEIETVPKQVTRDLFASSAWSSFPTARKSSSTQPATENESEPGFWGRLAASLADRGMEQRGEIERIEKLAQELRVQATMSGSNPTAYISGRLVRVGDTIKSFSVVAIEDRSVTLALDGHHVTLRIP